MLNEKNFKECPNISFDYAVMERHHSVRMLPLNSQWSDVGSWNAFAELFPRMLTVTAMWECTFLSIKNNFAYTTGRPIVTLGIEDTVIVETPDVVYVANISHTEELKEAVKKLKENNVNQALNHRQINRPWGYLTR